MIDGTKNAPTPRTIISVTERKFNDLTPYASDAGPAITSPMGSITAQLLAISV